MSHHDHEHDASTDRHNAHARRSRSARQLVLTGARRRAGPIVVLCALVALAATLGACDKTPTSPLSPAALASAQAQADAIQAARLAEEQRNAQEKASIRANPTAFLETSGEHVPRTIYARGRARLKEHAREGERWRSPQRHAEARSARHPC